MSFIWGFLQDDPNTSSNWFGRLRVKQKYQKQGEQARSSFYALKAFAGTADLLKSKNLVKGSYVVAEVEFRNGEAKTPEQGGGYYPDYHQVLNVVYAGPYGNEDQQGGGQGAPQQQPATYQAAYGAPQQQFTPAPAALPGPTPYAQPGFAPQTQSGFQPQAQPAFNPGSLTPPIQAGWTPPPPQGFAPPQQQGFAPPQQQGFAPPQQQGFVQPQPVQGLVPTATAPNATPADGQRPAWGQGNPPF